MKVIILLLLISTSVLAQTNEEIIRATAIDYAEGFYSGNVARMERALHPDLRKIAVGKLPQTGKSAIGYNTYSALIELTRSKAGFLEPEKRNLVVKVLQSTDDMAAVTLTSSQFNDYVTLVKIDSAWKIVNVLWTRGPGTPNYVPPEPYDAEREGKAVTAVVQQYFDGIFNAEPEKIEEVIHPEMALSQYVAAKETGKRMITRSGASAIIEPIRAKLRPIPQSQRTVDIKILDMMDNRAFLRTVTPGNECYIHADRIDGKWKILSILAKPITVLK